VVEQYGTVTKEEVDVAMRKYLHPANAVTAIAGTF